MPQPQEESDAIVEHKSISAPVPTVAPPRPVPPAPSDIGPPLRPAVPPVEAVAASEPRATPPAADPASLPATSREAVQAQAPVAKPAPPTSAAQPPANQDFATLVRYVTERAPALAYLREARALRWQDSQITIGLASDFDVQRTKNERPRLQELFNAAAGTPLVLEFVLDAQAAKDAAERETLAASEERARQAEQTRLRREASEHPSLKLVREVFGEVSFMEPELEAEVTVHG